MSDIPSRMCQDLLDLHKKENTMTSEHKQQREEIDISVPLYYTVDDDGNKYYDWDEIAIGVEEAISDKMGIYVCVGMRALNED